MARWLAVAYVVVIVLLVPLSLYRLTCYDALMTINLEQVYVSRSGGRVSWIANVTFSLTKFQPKMEDRIHKQWLRSDYDEEPTNALYFDLNIRLKGWNTRYEHVFKNVSFDRSGQYSVQLSHQIRNLSPGRYSLTLSRPNYFRSGIVDSEDWTMVVVFF
nr:hypothetical protein [Candidatus Njordarchaeum guaymaensis]